ncbi:MAG: enoyl-CoA hydratase-related protein [Reyranellaceae bacterium]
MAENPVLLTLDARGVATVTLNRPEVNNAYNGALIDGLLQALDTLDREAGLRAVVLRGNGKHFQAGADLVWIRAVRGQDAAANDRASMATAEAVRRLNEAPCPTVALIRGACIGGGTGIAAACDVVVAAEDAFFAISETRWGLMAGIIIPQLIDAMGVRQVRRYALTGERFDAHEARRIGLAHIVVPVDQLEAEGARIVDAILLNAPDATAQTKRRSLLVARSMLDPDTVEQLVREHAAKRQTDEAAEGLASFVEKRKPAWYRG